MPKMNAAGLALIKEFEGLELRAYPDPGTGGDPWTIGYGHTGPDVHPGLTWTQAQADAALKRDLERFEKGVNDSISRALNSNQFSALVSFTYNVGIGALRESTLLKLVNAGDFTGAADQFGKWVNGGNGPLPGLVRRRTAERALFLKP
ncbi:MAG: lysozyme [Candidatus Eremiobacteraeota bacterium]|nr:lysozyme [Candidatus Eremiobacteraeota bacterium]